MTQWRKPFIAGNWKMNGTLDSARSLATKIADNAQRSAADLLVCPPFPLIGTVAEALAGSAVSVGAQACHSKASGAYTGCVAAEMLADIGCSHVIVGHSERRRDCGETNSFIADQAAAAHRAGLVAIICVGETEAERDAGRTNAVIADQVRGCLPSEATARNTIIAYEPVWAIGSGKTPTVQEANAVHVSIRRGLLETASADISETIRILYGGSMKPDNAKELLAQPDIDGGLIGGAALNAADFLEIAAAAPL